MSILDTTVINVAIDRLAIDFNASLTTIQWVVTGDKKAGPHRMGRARADEPQPAHKLDWLGWR